MGARRGTRCRLSPPACDCPALTSPRILALPSTSRLPPRPMPNAPYPMQILYVTTFSASFSLLGLLTAGQLGPALRCAPAAAPRLLTTPAGRAMCSELNRAGFFAWRARGGQLRACSRPPRACPSADRLPHAPHTHAPLLPAASSAGTQTR